MNTTWAPSKEKIDGNNFASPNKKMKRKTLINSCLEIFLLIVQWIGTVKRGLAENCI